jgi:acetylornithine deacetylase
MRVGVEQVREAVASLREHMQELLLEVVRCPSLQGKERSAQDVMERVLRDELHMKTDRWALDEKQLSQLKGFSPVAWSMAQSECVVGTYDAVDPAARSLIINGHVDVVPVDPPHLWTREPFDAYVKEGWLYGRGSGDMKGGIVGAVVGLLALRKLGLRPAGRLHFETVPEEENTGNGALSCCARGYTADACVIPEPFGDTISIAQCGVMWMTVTLDGKPAHVLDTTAGVSAIQAAYAIFEKLRESEVRLNGEKHPAYAGVARPINYNLGTISGGNWPSSVASYCTFQVRVGLYPGADMAATRAQLEQVVQTRAAELAVKARVAWVGFQAEGFVADSKGPLFSELSAAFATATGRQPVLAPLTCTTDARAFHLYYGIPATCLGPLAQRIHGIDECVSLASVEEVAVTYALFIAQWCGLAKI